MQKEEIDKLIEVWKVLEVLTVSLDRLGTYERIHGREASERALSDFMRPPLFQQIAHARSLITSMLEEYDDTMYDKLDEIADKDCEPKYWNGPKTS